MAERWADLPAKLEALGRVAAQHGVSALVLREPATLAWLLEARVHVPQTLETACLDVVVETVGGAERLTVVTNAIEAPRLQETELAGLPAQWLVLPWWEARERRLPAGAATGCDRATAESVPVGPAVAALRRSLTPRQQALLGQVCRDAAAAATRTAEQITPRTTEYAAAGRFAAELMAAELDPIVLLVGGRERLDRHRHPLPTGAPLGRRAMLVCCARRHGLVASVTRIVSFDPLTGAERDAYQRLLEVERAFLDATTVGARLGEVFGRGAAAYAAHGFDEHEWHRHHQGGLSGFQPREFPAHHDSDLVLTEGMVAAWNPSGQGWKVEDTGLLRADGLDLLVTDPQWPVTEAGGRLRPDVLVR